jgi:hypothetical protein
MEGGSVGFVLARQMRWGALLVGALLILAVPTVAQAAPGWYSPTNLNGSASFGPDVGVDSSGQAITIFIEDGTFDLAKVAIRPAGGGLKYGVPVTISATNKNAFEPKVAVAPSGAAFVAWTNTTDTTIQGAFKPANSNTFGAPVTLSAAGAFRPDVSIDSQENATAIWARQTGSTSIIESTTRSASLGTFSAVEQLSESAFVSDNPQLAAEKNGDATATWTKFTGSGSIVESSARRDFVYARPASGTPFRVPLVPLYTQCTAPNTTHVAPLSLPSCNPPSLNSTILTMGTTGAGSGFLRYKIVPGDGIVPPDDADIPITVSLSDVRCAVGGVTGCTLPGSDYSAQLVAGTTMRMTDMSNGVFDGDPGTTQLATFTFPMGCTTTVGSAGSNCNVSTTADTLVPNFAKERRRAILSIESVKVTDLGADGTMTPGGGASCPPTCGSGDEKIYAGEGVVTP